MKTSIKSKLLVHDGEKDRVLFFNKKKHLEKECENMMVECRYRCGIESMKRKDMKK